MKRGSSRTFGGGVPGALCPGAQSSDVLMDVPPGSSIQQGTSPPSVPPHYISYSHPSTPYFPLPHPTPSNHPAPPSTSPPSSLSPHRHFTSFHFTAPHPPITNDARTVIPLRSIPSPPTRPLFSFSFSSTTPAPSFHSAPFRHPPPAHCFPFPSPALLPHRHSTPLPTPPSLFPRSNTFSFPPSLIFLHWYPQHRSIEWFRLKEWSLIGELFFRGLAEGIGFPGDTWRWNIYAYIVRYFNRKQFKELMSPHFMDRGFREFPERGL